MSTIAELRAQRASYVNLIAQKKELIRKYERAHESLTQFKGVVSRSQTDFHSVSRDKRNLLSGVESVQTNCKTAKAYNTGMNSVFANIGDAVVGLAYEEFLSSISAKLNQYASLINQAENNIVTYNRKISSIDQRIAAIKRAQEAAAAAAAAKAKEGS